MVFKFAPALGPPGGSLTETVLSKLVIEEPDKVPAYRNPSGQADWARLKGDVNSAIENRRPVRLVIGIPHCRGFVSVIPFEIQMASYIFGLSDG
jgi:hypothetical protein